MKRRRASVAGPWPPASVALYALGLAAALAVAFSLGGGETAPVDWALVAVPATLVAGASLVVRRANRGVQPAAADATR
jgi:peptidoglycan/LPS O-acetylase OafA/YrhL